MNRAVHGDVVVVEVFDEKEWKAPADEVVDQDGMLLVSPCLSVRLGSNSFSATLKNDDAEDSGEEGEDDNTISIREKQALKSENAKATSEKQPTGRIVGVIKRNWRAYVFNPLLTIYLTPPGWQLCVPYRQYIFDIFERNIAFSTNCLRHPSFSPPSAHPPTYPSSAHPHWPEDSGDHRQMGCYIPVSRRSFRPRPRKS